MKADTKQRSLLSLILEALKEQVSSKQGLSGQSLAHLASVLIKYEEEPGGPYKEIGGSIDIGTNAAIARLLYEVDALPAALTNFLQKNLTSKNEKTFQLSSSDCEWLCRPFTKLNNPHQLPENNQLIKIAEIINTRKNSQTSRSINDEIRVYEEITKNVTKDIENFNQEWRASARRLWSDMKAADNNHEIGLLPYWFAMSLNSKQSQTETVIRLGEANFWCWLAYTKIDHIIDGQDDVTEMPFARLLKKECLKHYKLATDKVVSKSLVQRTFNNMDKANDWELVKTRSKIANNIIQIPPLPRYGRNAVLARRAGGHTLGSLIIAQQSECFNHSYIKLLKICLNNFLIARQLLDDLHDWREDLSQGQISAVVVQLLRHGAIKPGKHNLNELTKHLQVVFKNISLPRICSMIDEHLQKSISAYGDIKLLKKDSPIMNLILDLNEANKQAKQKWQNYQDFAKQFSN